MSLVIAGRAHIRPSSRTYLAFGWKVREFADTTVFIEMDSRTRCLPRAPADVGLNAFALTFADRTPAVEDRKR